MKTKSRKKSALLIVALVGLATSVSSAQTYDPAADFSSVNNPNGVWSYGWSQTFGGPFIFDTATDKRSGVDLWLGQQAGDGNPVIYHNGTASAVTSGSLTIQPGQFGYHPGPSNQHSIVRFTAPAAGLYSLSASFTGIDFLGPTTTDIHILVHGASIFDGAVYGFGPGSGPVFSTFLILSPGDTVDFSVGFGQNGNSNDATGLAAQIVRSPESESADIKTGTTSITFSEAVSASLETAEVTLKQVQPARINPGKGALTFVVSGGAIDLGTARTEIINSGGITFLKGETRVVILDPIIELSEVETTIAKVSARVIVNGAIQGRMHVFNIGGTVFGETPVMVPKNKKITASDLPLIPTTDAANLLNNVLGVTVFNSDTEVATAKISVKLASSNL